MKHGKFDRGYAWILFALGCWGATLQVGAETIWRTNTSGVSLRVAFVYKATAGGNWTVHGGSPGSPQTLAAGAGGSFTYGFSGTLDTVQTLWSEDLSRGSTVSEWFTDVSTGALRTNTIVSIGLNGNPGCVAGAEGSNPVGLGGFWQPGEVATGVCDEVEPEWCLDQYVENRTSFPQQYEVFYQAASGGSAVREALIYLLPGSSQVVSITGKAEKGSVVVANKPTQSSIYLGDGMYLDAPTGQYSFEADDGSSSWYSCGGTAGPQSQALHMPETQQLLPMNSTNYGTMPIQFSQAASTNPVSEDTVQSGFQALVRLQLDQQQKELGHMELQSAALSNISSSVQSQSGFLGSIATNTASLTNGIRTTNQFVAGGSQVNTNVSDYFTSAAGEYTGGSNTVSGYRETIGSASNFVSGVSFDADFWMVDVPALAMVAGSPEQINFNPMANATLQSVASWCKGVFSWLCVGSLLYYIVERLKRAAYAQASFQQGRAPNIGASVLGVGVQSSLFLHLPIFGVVVAVLVAIAAIGATWISGSGLLAAFGINPFASSVPAINQALWLLMEWIDLPLMLTHLSLVLLFEIALFLHGFVGQIIIRAMPGCILCICLSLDCLGAARVEVSNYAGTNAVLTSPDFAGVSFYLPPGDSVSYEGLVSDVGVSVGLSTNVWDNSYATEDAVVRLRVAESSGGIAFVVEEGKTVEQSFLVGLGLGSVLLFVRGFIWVSRLMRPGSEGGV